MESLPRKVLCDLLRDHGRNLMTDPRLKGLLMDYCGNCRAEIHVLIQVQQAGIPERLWRDSQRLPVSVVVAQLSMHLETDYFVAEAAARWAIETWALALGLELPIATLPVAPLPAISNVPGVRAEQQEESATIPATDSPQRFPLIPQPQHAQPTTRIPLTTTTCLPFEPEMILIPAGEFLMGSDPHKDKGAYDDEQPQHTLYLPDYFIAKTLVTNAQYAAFVKATGYKAPRDWQRGKIPQVKEASPVVYVSWNDVWAYCEWLVEATSKLYTLPSEAEWEKAARGLDGRLYPWGNTFNKGKCNVKVSNIGHTTPVDQYPNGASPYGVLDMAGNVWERTRSLFNAYPYDPMDGRENVSASGHRVVRGGVYYGYGRHARCAYRDFRNPGYINSDLGFRVVVSLSCP